MGRGRGRGAPTAAAKEGSGGPPAYSKAARRFFNSQFREPERLSKVLAAAGVASRRGSEDIIFSGRVTVNGAVCKLPQTLVDVQKDSIYVDGSSLSRKAVQKLYFMLNKPKGYICSNASDGPKPVLELLDPYFKIFDARNPGAPRPRLFTVGRLDVATTGLLLITNDGDFAQGVGHPSAGLTKEYIATVRETVTKRQLGAMAEGTVVHGVRCVPVAVSVLDDEPGEPHQRVQVVVSEGRNHEVRHIVESAGLTVKNLKRVRIGPLRMPRKLPVGKFQVLTSVQVSRLLSEKVQASP